MTDTRLPRSTRSGGPWGVVRARLARHSHAAADVARYLHAAQVSATVHGEGALAAAGGTADCVVRVRNAGDSPLFEVALAFHDRDLATTVAGPGAPGLDPGGDLLLPVLGELRAESRYAVVGFTDIDGVRWQLDVSSGLVRELSGTGPSGARR